MNRAPSLDDLWNSVPVSGRAFDPRQLDAIPPSARRYRAHAIAEGAPLASSVRLRMHGDIKLKGWYPFTAEEVIHWNRGMIWSASVRIRGVTIRGSDRFLNGRGEMLWKLFGIIPIVKASGADI